VRWCRAIIVGVDRDARSSASARQADRRRATRPQAEALTSFGVVAVGDPQGRLVRQRLLRRRELLRRDRLPACRQVWVDFVVVDVDLGQRLQVVGGFVDLDAEDISP
jgi:hypothetical protein